MNLVTLIGRLTRDPELKFSQSGKAFCKFSIAVQRDFKKDEADFINCIAWDKRAELLTEYLRKGRQIAIQGRMSVRSYKDKEEQTKWVTDVIVDKFNFVDYQKSDTEYNDTKENKNSNAEPEFIDDDSFPF